MPSNVEPVPYDPENVFAKILRGEIPAHIVYEDEYTLAFMDVMPQGAGHTLVIPKAPARGLLDTDPASLAATTATVQRVARAVKTAFLADGLTIFQYNEPAGGQTVFHLHIHIVPRFDGVALARHTGKMADSDLLGIHAAQIRAALDGA